MNSIIELYCSESQVVNDSIDRIVVELHSYKKKEDSKSLLLTGCSTKSGTTTIAISLAIALSMAGWKTLLVDGDLRKGPKFKRLNESIEIGLTDYLTGKANKKDIIFETNYKNLEYIPSGTMSKSPIRMLCSAKMEQLTEEVNQEYDYIIFDFPSLNVVSDANILFPSVDGIILIAALEQTTKRQLGDAKRKMREYQDKYYGLIVNQVQLPQYRKHIKDYDYFKEQNLIKRLQLNIKNKSKGDKR